MIAGALSGNPGVLVKSGSIFGQFATGDLWQTFQSYTIDRAAPSTPSLSRSSSDAVEASAAAPGLGGADPDDGASASLDRGRGRRAAATNETREAIRLAAEGGVWRPTTPMLPTSQAWTGSIAIALFVNRDPSTMPTSIPTGRRPAL